MLDANDMINATAKRCILFANQAILTDMLSPISNLAS